MDPQTKKYVTIGACAIGGPVYFKNKWEQNRFVPIDRNVVISIIKRAKKQNYVILKKIATFAVNMSQQVQQVNPQMLKTYLESPQSPVRIPDQFQQTQRRICAQQNISYNDYNNSIQFYVKNGDKQIIHLVQTADKDFATALTGKLPQPKVSVPEFLTKQKVLEIQRKLTLKKYLVQIDMYRKLRGRSRQAIAQDAQLLKSLPNPQEEEQKILQDQGLGVNDDPPAVVFANAILKYRSDSNFTKQIANIENEYKKIYSRFLPKMQQHNMTEEQLNDMQYQLIYTQADY